MKNIQEYFGEMYEQDFDNAVEVENQVWNWYNNNEQKFDEWVKENNIDIYDVVDMINGEQEYSITLWVWDMCDE